MSVHRTLSANHILVKRTIPSLGIDGAHAARGVDPDSFGVRAKLSMLVRRSVTLLCFDRVCAQCGVAQRRAQSGDERIYSI
jgi:hypothetical protein